MLAVFASGRELCAQGLGDSWGVMLVEDLAAYLRMWVLRDLVCLRFLPDPVVCWNKFQCLCYWASDTISMLVSWHRVFRGCNDTKFGLVQDKKKKKRLQGLCGNQPGLEHSYLPVQVERFLGSSENLCRHTFKSVYDWFTQYNFCSYIRKAVWVFLMAFKIELWWWVRRKYSWRWNRVTICVLLPES